MIVPASIEFITVAVLSVILKIEFYNAFSIAFFISVSDNNLHKLAETYP